MATRNIKPFEVVLRESPCITGYIKEFFYVPKKQKLKGASHTFSIFQGLALSQSPSVCSAAEELSRARGWTAVCAGQG